MFVVVFLCFLLFIGSFVLPLVLLFGLSFWGGVIGFGGHFSLVLLLFYIFCLVLIFEVFPELFQANLGLWFG